MSRHFPCINKLLIFLKEKLGFFYAWIDFGPRLYCKCIVVVFPSQKSGFPTSHPNLWGELGTFFEKLLKILFILKLTKKKSEHLETDSDKKFL